METPLVPDFSCRCQHCSASSELRPRSCCSNEGCWMPVLRWSAARRKLPAQASRALGERSGSLYEAEFCVRLAWVPSAGDATLDALLGSPRLSGSAGGPACGDAPRPESQAGKSAAGGVWCGPANSRALVSLVARALRCNSVLARPAEPFDASWLSRASTVNRRFIRRTIAACSPSRHAYLAIAPVHDSRILNHAD